MYAGEVGEYPEATKPGDAGEKEGDVAPNPGDVAPNIGDVGLYPAAGEKLGLEGEAPNGDAGEYPAGERPPYGLKPPTPPKPG